MNLLSSKRDKNNQPRLQNLKIMDRNAKLGVLYGLRLGQHDLGWCVHTFPQTTFDLENLSYIHEMQDYLAYFTLRSGTLGWK